MSYATHTMIELRLALTRQFPSAFVDGPAFMNSVYCAVTRDWVENHFATYYFQYLAARGQKTYAKRGNQCEHFALHAALEAVDLFRQSTDPEIPADAESVAVAWAKYFRADGLGWHEVNLWFLDGVWTPWEPQQMSFFTFTASEIQTTQQIGIP
jgi:hypothetical protein